MGHLELAELSGDSAQQGPRPGAARAGHSQQTQPGRPQKSREVGRLDPGRAVRLDLSGDTAAESEAVTVQGGLCTVGRCAQRGSTEQDLKDPQGAGVQVPGRIAKAPLASPTHTSTAAQAADCTICIRLYPQQRQHPGGRHSVPIPLMGWTLRQGLYTTGLRKRLASGGECWPVVSSWEHLWGGSKRKEP